MNTLKNTSRCVAAILAWASGPFALATAISVPNFSFQSTTVSDGGTSVAVPNWTFLFTGSAAGGVEDPVDAAYPGTTGDNFPASGPGTMDGGQSAFITLPDSVSVATGRFVSGASLGTVTDNTTYTLTVAVGDPLDAEPVNVIIELLVNGTSIASTASTGALLGEGTFIDLNTAFTTGASDPLSGGTLMIRLTHSKTNLDPDIFPSVSFDNVRLDATVAGIAPEPASATLLGAAGLGLVAYRLRHRGRPRRQAG